MIVPPYKGLSIDTRTIVPDNLFVAIKGERFDGHAFVDEAVRKGAAGVVVSKPVKTTVPVITVEDTDKALGELGKAWRDQFTLPIIGLTGSNGKTTTKNMIAAIFKEAGKKVLATEGNLNNHWGVPIMLSRLEKDHDVAVIEMGMNHFGEIAYLTQLVKPTIALITNAGPSHLEGVGGTISGVAKAKGEIFEGLAKDGIAVINGEDKFADTWKKLAGDRKIIYFDSENPKLNYSLKLLGKHNKLNAQAAAAVALACGIDKETIEKALGKIEPGYRRMETKKGKNGAIIIDDTYNANPLSLKAALESIAYRKNKKILVLGDMRELGEQGPEMHRESGKLARESGIAVLLTLGELTKNTVESFGENAQNFETHEAIIKAVLPYLEKDNLILVKGSLSMNMNKVVNAIVDKQALVVDDDSDIRAEIKKILINLGYDITEAVNGKESVDIIKKNKDKFDLVTMDFQMPEMNGGDAAHAIHQLNKHIKIVGLSSSSVSMKKHVEKLKLNIPVLSKGELPGVLVEYLRDL